MISYDKLVKILKQNGLKKSDLTKVLGISSRTIVKIGKGEKIADNVLRKIADYFGCLVEDLYREVCDNPVLQVLREEMEGFLPPQGSPALCQAVFCGRHGQYGAGSVRHLAHRHHL